MDKLNWVMSVTVYSADVSDTEESLRKDPDLQLLPHLIDKVVIPKLEGTFMVSCFMKPISDSQIILFS